MFVNLLRSVLRSFSAPQPTRRHHFRRSIAKGMAARVATLESRQLLTAVSADISSTTTWNAAGSPYNLTANIHVLSGSTLNITSGVNVTAGGNFSITVDAGATLIANGATFNANVVAASGSTITLNNNNFASGVLQLSTSSATIAGNTFHSGTSSYNNSVWIAPNLVSILQGNGNSFAAGSNIGITTGSISGTVQWPKIADGYVLVDSNGAGNAGGGQTVTVTTTGTLTIAAGNLVTLDTNDSLFVVNGKLNLSGNSSQAVYFNGTINAQATSQLNFTYGIFGANVVVNGIATLSNNTFNTGVLGIPGRLEIYSTSVTLNSNIFHAGTDSDTTPIWINPNLVNLLQGNNFNSTTYIGIVTGSISSAIQWPKLTDGYVLIDGNGSGNAGGDQTVTIASGGSLTIAAGNVVTQATSTTNGLFSVSGTLNLPGTNSQRITFSANISGGSTSTVNIFNSTLYANVILQNAGTLSNNIWNSGRLDLSSGLVTLISNTFHPGSDSSSTPIWISPNLVPKLQGSTFSSTNLTYIGIKSGSITSNIAWSKFADGYILVDSNGSGNAGGGQTVNVEGGGALTIAPGNVVTLDPTSGVGSSAITFGATGNGTGALYAVGIQFGLDLTFGVSASGVLRESTFVSNTPTVKIDNNASLVVRQNNFQGVKEVKLTSNGGTFDLQRNYWGTTDTTAIGALITDQADVATLTQAIYTNPIAFNTVGGTVWSDDNSDGVNDYTTEAGVGSLYVRLWTAGLDGIANTADDSVIATTTTDSLGDYYLIVPNAYTSSTLYLQFFGRPTDFSFSPQKVSSATPWTDSDPDTVTGYTATFPWTNFTTDFTNDAGLVASHAPTDIQLDNLSVAENQPIGTVVGNLTTTDQDPGDTATYSLVSGTGSTDNASFQIVGGVLKTAAVFDYETKNSYSIRIRTTDSKGLTFEKQFTISIIDVNEAPTNLILSAATVPENQPIGTLVGTLSSVDQDANNTFTYTLVSGTGSTDNASFAIVGNSLKTGAVFNYEAKNSYSIRVQTQDQGGLTFQKVFTITITNVNEAPTNIALSAASLPENQPAGTSVGTFSTTDPDQGDSSTYSLVTGTGSADNGSFQIAGNVLKTTVSFNYEVKNSYSIRVRATDSGGLTFDKVFTITVTNVVEAPALTNAGVLAYAVGQAATPISPALVVANDEGLGLTSAQVIITNYLASNDRLVFTANPATMGNITGGFSTTTGKATFTSAGGTATLAQWQAALRSVSYLNVAASPNKAPRPVSYQIFAGAVSSNIVIGKVGIGTSPVLANASLLNYAKGQAATPVNTVITVTDPDHPNLVSATIKVTNYVVRDDRLAYVNNDSTLFGNIQGGFSTTTGQIILTSANNSATLAQWQAALRSITYVNVNTTSPNLNARTVTYQVTDGTLTSNVITSTIGLGSAPSLSLNGWLNYSTASTTGQAINTVIQVKDPDHPNLASATVTLTNFYSKDDLLAFVNNNATLFGNIQGSFSTTTGVLRLTSSNRSATLAQWQAALRAVTYFNRNGVNANTAPRFANFQISDGYLISNVIQTVIAFV